MRKRLLVVCFLFIPLLAAKADNQGLVPDSLVRNLQLAVGDDYQRAMALCDIINYYLPKEDYTHSKPYVDDFVKLSESLDDDYFHVLRDYYRLIFLTKDNDFQGEITLIKTLQVQMEKLPDDERSNMLRIAIYVMFLRFYYGLDMISQAYVELNKAFKVAEKLNSESVEFSLNRRLMILYSSMGMNRESIDLGKKIAGYKLKNVVKSYYYLGMAGAYMDLRSYDTAWLYTDSALMGEPTKNIDYLAYDYKNRIGLVREDDALISRCCDSMLMSLEKLVLPREDSLYIVYRTSYFKAYLFDRSHQYDSALYYVDRALETVRVYVSLDDECKIMELKTGILINSHCLQEALDNIRSTDVLRDSLSHKQDLQNAERLVFQKKMAEYEAEMQYENRVRESKQRTRVWILLFVTLLFLMGCIILALVMKKRKLQQRMIEEELEDRNRELASTAVLMMKKNEAYSEVIASLQDIREHSEDKNTKKALAKVSRKIEQTMEEGYYDEFDVRFKRVHPDFIAKLTKKHPNLTPNEIKICSFLKLNMSTKEIASLTGQSVTAIEMARYRIRRKLGISIDDHAHLSQYIMKI